ncbi:MAG TPA: hypothetical protein VHR84_17610 [Terriglobales bacterium]|jgi:hypothetical protein|nr:hypothetical protein [Terriglobales bacterium]
MRWIDAIGGLGWTLLVVGVVVCFSTAGERSELYAWTVGGVIWLAGFVMILTWLLKRLTLTHHGHSRRALPR